MDNHRIDLTREGESRFRTVLSLLLSQHNRKDGLFEHYCVDPDVGLVLFWTKCSISQPLPYPMRIGALVEFAWNWLDTADYGRKPNFDGSSGKGWRIYNEDWGHVKGEWAAICAIQPVWAMYGK